MIEIEKNKYGDILTTRSDNNEKIDIFTTNTVFRDYIIIRMFKYC